VSWLFCKKHFVYIIARRCIREHYIGSEGYRQILIPVESVVLLNTCILHHRREEYWPRPLESDYMRWIRDPVAGLQSKLVNLESKMLMILFEYH
jgi:hypothetical protein